MNQSCEVIKTLLIFFIGIKALVLCNHLPQHRIDYPETLTLNKRFFNDVRDLIKRRLQENAALQQLHTIDDDVNNNEISPYQQQQQQQQQLQLQQHEQPFQVTHKRQGNAAILPPTPVLVENWPTKTNNNFGQITAVSVDPKGNPVIFQRADRVWDGSSFMDNNIYNFIDNGPIAEKTIHILDPKTGAVQASWGEHMFFMPHGLTIDQHGHYWITDVAMHQAFKFRPFGDEPLLTIGKFGTPGSSVNYLCKPTSVAVASTGEFFIADGYCNHRILKYNAAGRLLRTIPQPPEFLSLQVPHALTLLEQLDLLCIADRENMRVVCPKAGLKSSQGEGQPAATIQEPDLGHTYGVAAYGDYVYAVNGPTGMLPVRGFTIDPRSETIIGHWGEFKQPHAIAVSVNGSALYVVETGTDRGNHIWKYVLV